MPPRRRELPGLPDLLKSEPPSVKLVWLFLAPQGVVDYSQRELAGALGLEQKAVGTALSRLRELALLEDLEREPRRRGRYRLGGF